MRKFALVVLGIDNKIKDRFNLDLVTDPKGLGFKLKLSIIEGDIEDVITKVVQVKGNISMRINQVNWAYQKAIILSQWIEKYSTVLQRMALEYSDGVRIRYCLGKVVDLGRDELTEYKTLVQDLSFQPITPFFTNVENVIKIEVSDIGKRYPFKYPYAYGTSIVSNNNIANPYIADIPLTVTINGGISQPQVQLLDDKGNYYNRVRFSGLTLNRGQSLIINSATNKIYYINGESVIDYTPEVDPRYDTFLRAKSGNSTISVNSNDSSEGFSLSGSWWQFGL